MFRSFRIGSLFGIPIKLDITFLLILPVFAWIIGSQISDLTTLLNTTLSAAITSQRTTSEQWPWILGSIAALGLFASVVLHELGHSLMAIRYDVPIDSITLWLFGGIAQLTDQPTDWRQEFTIAIAGPAVSVGIGLGAYAVMVVLPVQFDAPRFVFGYLAVMNIALAAFNMLPGFPMDGGRVLRALLSRNRPFTKATQIAAEVGKGFAVILGLVGLLMLNIFYIGLAFFIYIGAVGEAQQTVIKTAFEGVTVHDIMTPASILDTVSSEMTITDLLEQMFTQRHTGYPVVDEGRLVGIVTLNDAHEIISAERDAFTVADAMSTDLLTISPESDAMEAFTEIHRHEVGRLLVTDERGELVGLISRTDLVTALNIIRQSGEQSHPSA